MADTQREQSQNLITVIIALVVVAIIVGLGVYAYRASGTTTDTTGLSNGSASDSAAGGLYSSDAGTFSSVDSGNTSFDDTLSSTGLPDSVPPANTSVGLPLNSSL